MWPHAVNVLGSASGERGSAEPAAGAGMQAGRCRLCGATVPLSLEARYCGACGGAWPLGRIDPAPYILPLWQLALYCVLSLGLYVLPWAARVARFVRAARGEETTRWSGVGHALALLVPLYNLRAYYRLVDDARTAVGAAKNEAPHPGRSLSLLIAAGAVGRVLPDGWALLGLPLCVAALWPVQRAIDDRCRALAPAAVPRFRRFGPAAIVGLVAACLLWGLFGLGLVGPTAIDTLLGRTPVADGTIAFGHGVDSSGRALHGMTRHFHVGDQIAWIASFAQPLSSNTLTLTVDEARGAGAWSSVLRLPETIPGATGVSYIYDQLPLSDLSASWPHATGHFRMSYWAQGHLIARGTFDVAPRGAGSTV